MSYVVDMLTQKSTFPFMNSTWSTESFQERWTIDSFLSDGLNVNASRLIFKMKVALLQISRGITTSQHAEQSHRQGRGDVKRVLCVCKFQSGQKKNLTDDKVHF